MATVYLATDLKHHRKVAIKVLRAEVGASLGSARFLREIEIAAGLVHPHILSLHDSGEADGMLFFVMPYVDGETLRHRLARERRLPLDEAVKVVREVADALGHAHARGVVHRDIKPANILFESGHAIVSDFGVARAVTVAGDESITMAGVVVGTPAYMSPEQSVGDHDVDARSDVYSLGCVAYEMLTGEQPFAAPSAQAVLARKMIEAPTGLRSVVRDLPESVERVVSMSMARLPSDRYATASEFSRALEEAAGQPNAKGAPIRLQRVSRRKLAIGALAATLVIGAVVLSSNWLKPAAVRSLAVLPFTSPASDSTQPYFIEGMHDEIIGELGKITALRVISRTSVMQYRGTTKTIPEIARELGVDAVVEGALYRSSNSVRIQLRLIRAVPEERQIWSHTYDTDMRNLLALHDDVARGIVDQLRVALTSQEERRLTRPRDGVLDSTAPPPAAYDQYLQGRYWLNRRTAEGMERAEAAFRQAIALDQNFAAAHAALASTLALAVDWHYRRIDPFAVSRAAIEEANEALSLDSSSADALAARGRALSATHAPENLVRRDFERAIAIAPQHANAHGWYAMELAWRGRYAESRAENDTAIALDPLAPGRHMGFAISAINAGDLDVALREARRVVLLESALSAPRMIEGLALLLLGRPQECLAVPLERFVSTRAMCLHSVGRSTKARRLADSVGAHVSAAMRRGGLYADMLQADNLALYYAWIGDVEATLHWMRQAAEISPASAPSLYINTKAFDSVRRDPRFADGLAKLNESIWRRVNTPPLRLQ